MFHDSTFHDSTFYVRHFRIRRFIIRRFMIQHFRIQIFMIRRSRFDISWFDISWFDFSWFDVSWLNVLVSAHDECMFIWLVCNNTGMMVVVTWFPIHESGWGRGGGVVPRLSHLSCTVFISFHNDLSLIHCLKKSPVKNSSEIIYSLQSIGIYCF